MSWGTHAGAGVRPIEFDGERVVMLDQRLLPDEEVYRVYTTAQSVAGAIRDMVIRGAPAIGIAAAYGASLAAHAAASGAEEEFDVAVQGALDVLERARPTAVNLFWAVETMRRALADTTGQPLAARARHMESVARRVHTEDAELCARMGRAGAALIADDAVVLTHCNTGALATGGIGTALGVIRAAVRMGKRVRVFAGETRPYLQGARLTVWELLREGVDVTLVVDSAAAWVMKSKGVDAVFVGADRIAANGDTANKVGTYALALLAQAHGVPFYVVAPSTTVDLETASGDGIAIEERPESEVREMRGVQIAPEGVAVFNPAFDVTPSTLITAIITEHGVARPPYSETLRPLGG